MSKRLALRCLFAVAALALGALSATAIPNLTPAPFVGACGYNAYVTSPPHYWVASPSVSLSECQNVQLPALVADVTAQGYRIDMAVCRPNKWCPF